MGRQCEYTVNDQSLVTGVVDDRSAVRLASYYVGNANSL